VISTEIDRPLIIFDGRCAFCRRWVERAKSITGSHVDYEPYQEAAARFPQINPAAFGRAVHLIEPGGQVSRGAEAVFRALKIGGRYPLLTSFYEVVPGFAGVTEAMYRAVAGHREIADRIDLLLIGPQTQQSSYLLTRQIFLRLLGLIYLFAFVSLWLQIDGLIGSRGILPVGWYLRAISSALGHERYWQFPTLCWFNSSDAFLHFLCAGGTAAAVCLMAGVWELTALVVLFAFYLSLAVAGQDFLEFQWDSLLLEAGFLAIFLAPRNLWSWRLARQAEPSRLIVWMMRWLLFRLTFMSGVVKLTSGDVAWHGWKALRYHYMTQPLPTWTSWYMHQCAPWFQTFSCGVVFAAELIVPFLMLGPRRVRLVAFWAAIFFQFLIAATGNYGFFNLLVLVLCLPMIEDASAFWKWVPGGKWLVRRASPHGNPAAAPRRGAGPDEGALARPGWILAPIAIFLVFLSVMAARRSFLPEAEPPTRLEATANYFAPFQIANSYGLFAIMTTDRPEIIVSGSDDGVHWTEYPFKYKPGDVRRRPRFCTPWMPRLDWRMWFMALDDEQAGPNGWDGTVLELFLRRLLHASPSVVGLLADNPFPGHPPKFVRADLFQYRFTTVAEKRATGDWWHREFQSPIIELSREPQR
jgi:predicted DCC family thiol-disulfide oxidoreductase YuxK